MTVWHVTLHDLPTDKGNVRIKQDDALLQTLTLVFFFPHLQAAELVVDGKSVWKSPDDGRDHSGNVDIQGGDRYHQATFTLKISVMGFEVRVKLVCLSGISI